MSQKNFYIIGEVMNNAYGRARKAWSDRNVEGYQSLARKQADLGAHYLDLNLDGTQNISVKIDEMLEFLPTVLKAIQEVTDVPLCFDNPSLEFHRTALENYDRSKSGQPILNSIAASREGLDEMIQLVAEHDTKVIVMASEHFTEDGDTAACLKPQDIHKSARYFVERLVSEAGRKPDEIIIDAGLAPVGADTYGLVNLNLDGMELIRQDTDFEGCHFVVGLSNFAWGTPREIRHDLERAYLTLGIQRGLDFAIANPEANPVALPEDHPLVAQLQAALEQGRVQGDETQEDAGFRQAEAIMDICRAARD